MKTLTLALALLAFPALSHAAEYSIDPDHTKVAFKVKHLGISWVPGEFTKLEGNFQFDQKNIASSKAEAKIQVASISTDNAKRDDHLKSDDFFAAQKFPEISFVSKAIKNVSGDKFVIVGDLTIHGVTKSVELNAEFSGAVKDPWGNDRAAFEATTTLNRKDFGLVWNKVLEAGGVVVGEEVKVTIDVEGIQKKG